MSSRRAGRAPNFFFVGVSTSQSSIMTVFPKWAAHLRLDASIAGIDCKVHDDPPVYRGVVARIKEDPRALGALVTTHKIDLLAAARDLFDELDPHARLLGEISCISKRDGRLRGHAKDPETSGLSLEAFVEPGYWGRSRAEVCILGAGGSSLALTTHLMSRPSQADRPRRIVVTNRSEPRLAAMRAVHAGINPGIEVEYVHAPRPEINDEAVGGLAPGSLVVNATGLGKDAPGSPLTDRARFPENGLVWEFNYRGKLVFLEQAAAQRAGRNLRIEDGWTYFVHGWTRVIAEVFAVEIPTAGPGFEALSRIAAEARGG
jgi:shikimate 5-dehydrogenase